MATFTKQTQEHGKQRLDAKDGQRSTRIFALSGMRKIGRVQKKTKWFEVVS